jgi:hypothetical protein
MLRLNLSSRPFYNDRAVTAGIVVIAVLTAALTAFNVVQIISLNNLNRELAAQVGASESRAAELRGKAQATRQAMNQDEVSIVQEEARAANVLINRRVFSWTDLFNHLEETLPEDVRVLAVAPQVDREGRMLVAMTAVARDQASRDAFIDRLEKTGAFSGVLPRSDQVEDDGTLRSVIQGYYTQTARQGAADSSPPASDSNVSEGNASPRNSTPDKPRTGEAR